MMAFFAESRLGAGELQERAAKLDALVLDPSIARSGEALELAWHLSGKSIRNGTAISRKRKYEFLLWLSGKTDIRSALAQSAPKDPKDILIVVFDGKKAPVLEAIEAEEKEKSLKRGADSLELEGISLSRIKN